jgi:hypothetical protein
MARVVIQRFHIRSDSVKQGTPLCAFENFITRGFVSGSVIIPLLVRPASKSSDYGNVHVGPKFKK